MGEDHSRPVIRTENKINCFCLSDTSFVYQEVNQMIPWLKCYFHKVEREKNKKIENDWAIVNYLSNCTIDNVYKTIVSHHYETYSNLYSHNNILLCYINSENSNYAKGVISFLENKNEEHYQPLILFISPYIDDVKKEVNLNFKSYNKKKLFYCKKDLNVVFTILMELYISINEFPCVGYFLTNPLSNAGCLEYTLKLFAEYMSSTTQKDILNQEYKPSLNILFAGRPGVGKSSFINTILGEEQCKENRGMSITQGISLFHHKTLNIGCYDTAGFNNKQDSLQLQYNITNINTNYNFNYHVHIVLFLINATARSLLDGDKEFIQYCNAHKIPIIIVITHCLTPTKGENAKYIIQNDLKAVCPAITVPIVCVQLKDEPDLNAKHFGFDTLMMNIKTKLSNLDTFTKAINTKNSLFLQGGYNCDLLFNRIYQLLNKRYNHYQSFIPKWFIKATAAGYGLSLSLEQIQKIIDSNKEKDISTEIYQLKSSIKKYCEAQIIGFGSYKSYISSLQNYYKDALDSLSNLTPN